MRNKISRVFFFLFVVQVAPLSIIKTGYPNLWTNETHASVIPSFGEDYYDFLISKEDKSPNSTCSKSYTEDEGEILSPNHPGAYPDDVFCQWNITVSPNMSILLIVIDLELRIRDKIFVYDGLNEHDKLLKAYSRYSVDMDGNQFNAISSKNQLNVKFFSKKHYLRNSAINFFKFKYKAIKQGCGHDYKETEGIITSPGYPDNYPAKVNCLWTISADPNKSILIIFDEFDLGSGQDTLIVGYGKSFSGNSVPKNLISQTSYLTFEFTSGSNSNGRAFKLRYKTKDWVENMNFLIFASNAIIKIESSVTKTVAINGHKITKLTAYGQRKDTLVWFEPLSHQIYIKLDNNNTKTIKIKGRPNSLALDYNNDLIYWIDIRTKTIRVIDINDENQNIYVVSEIKNENPRDLVINVKKSALIWSDVGFEPKIMYSNMDGSAQNILYSNSRQAFYLTIDYQKEKYYFVDISDHSLHSIDFDGNNETFYIKSSEYFASINTMRVLNNDLYLANDYMVYRLPELDLRIEDTQVLFSTQKYSSGYNALLINRQWFNSFELIDDILQPIADSIVCPSNECQHLCLSSDHSFRCLNPISKEDSAKMSLVSAQHYYEKDSVDKLSIFNTILISLMVISNAFMGYVLFRYVFKRKLPYTKCSFETRLPLEGIDNEVLIPDHSKSREQLLDFEIHSTL